DEVAERTRRSDGGLDGAELHALDHLTLAAESGRREMAELVLAVGRFLHMVRPGLGGCTIVRIDSQGIAQLDFGLCSCCTGAECADGNGYGAQGARHERHRDPRDVVFRQLPAWADAWGRIILLSGTFSDLPHGVSRAAPRCDSVRGGGLCVDQAVPPTVSPSMRR